MYLFRESHRSAVIAVVLLMTAGWITPAHAVEVARRCWSMGTWVDVVVGAEERAIALNAAEAAVQAIESAERRLSTWREDSELSLLNSSEPGEWIALSPELSTDLREAVQCFQSTGGAFNPGMAALVQIWDLRGRGRVPSAAEVATAVRHSRMGDFELKGTSARRSGPGFGIEEGGFGKGVALRDGAHAALQSGADCVRLNFGGQTHSDGSCGQRPIQIAHPHDRGEVIAELSIGVGSIATSGNSERGSVFNDERVGHLLDPSSGTPATDFGSVTVISNDPVAADCVATALYVMGPNRGMEWLETNPGFEALFAVVGADGVHLLKSNSLLGRVGALDSIASARSFDGQRRVHERAMVLGSKASQ